MSSQRNPSPINSRQVASAWICTALVFVCGGCAGGDRRVDFVQLDAKLRAIITDKASDDAALLQAISRLGRVNEPPWFWTAIANNSAYPLQHRRRCIFALFRRHGQRCPNVGALAQRLAPADWLKGEHIQEVTEVFGWIPVSIGKGGTVFEIDVLPTAETRPCVFVRVEGVVTKERFMRVLQRKAAPPDDIMVLEYGFTDDYDKWLNGATIFRGRTAP